MNNRIPVAILGATGIVGQRFVQLLDGHEWFQVCALTGSHLSAGKPYREVCHWVLSESMPEWAGEMPVLPVGQELSGARVAFSALPAEMALQIEPRLAQEGLVVCSNASAFRREADVPILMPEVNPEHAALLELQRRQRSWKGGIATNPNCTSTGLTVALKALQEAFGLRRVFAVSMQALSGAGFPGVASLDILDNVIPYIAGEEEKVEYEPRKILGRLKGDGLHPAEFAISAHTNRVAVGDGHLVCVSLELEHPADLAMVGKALHEYTAPSISRDLPSAPHPVILLRQEPDRPQPRLDRQSGNGMTTVVGRLRPDPLFHMKMVVLSHNTVRGAAGGSIYNAELLVKMGVIA